jgi:hypothetical protein
MELQKGCLEEARDQRRGLTMFLPSSSMLELAIIALQMSISISALVTGTCSKAETNFFGHGQYHPLEHDMLILRQCCSNGNANTQGWRYSC